MTGASSKQTFGSGASTTTNTYGLSGTSQIPSFPGELEELQSVLHFPEEVALRITDAEYQLFYQVNCQSIAFHVIYCLSFAILPYFLLISIETKQVPPVDYFKNVILELRNETNSSHKNQHQSSSSTSSSSNSGAPQTVTSTKTSSTITATAATIQKTSIPVLQKRFEEVIICEKYDFLFIRL